MKATTFYRDDNLRGDSVTVVGLYESSTGGIKINNFGYHC
jgi:hypothetical protein